MKIKHQIKAAKSVPPFKKEEFKKQLQDELYSAFIQLARTPEWGFADIGEIDDLLMPIIEIEDYKGDYDRDLRIEFRGEVNYSELMDVCNSFNKVIQKYDKSAYFEPVDVGIAEAFIRTDIQSCTQVTASDEVITLDEVKSIIDGYGDKYFETIPPTHGNDSFWLDIFDDGSYNIQLMDNRIVMTSIDNPFKDFRFFDTLDSFNGFMERVYQDRLQNADETYTVNASTDVKAYEFAETEDGWGENVEEALSSVFARAEDLMYEVRNTVRGANTDCETVEDLADFIRQLASEFAEAADELESL